MANVSVGKMFFAGYLPGITITLVLMVAVSIIAHRRNYPCSRDKLATPKMFFGQLKDSAWALFLPLGILLGLRLGMFTPTEGGAMSVFYCIFVGKFIYKRLTIAMLPKILFESVLGTASVMFIIAAAASFGYYMSWERVPHLVSEWLVNLSDNPYLMLFLINLFLLFVGMFIEGTAAMIILTPLLVPTVVTLGIDPVHFGIIMGVNLVMGGVTPPFGTLMFLTCSITKISVGLFVKESWSLIIALVIALMIITYIPPLSLLLPNFLK
jgi:tripartite ATP-independent transporter DctM subunit